MARSLRALGRRLHYGTWRLLHPTADYAVYYAASIARRLDRGGRHRHLGRLDDFPRRGRQPFHAMVAWGLAPHHRCIDYGCGSLRVGQHFVRALLPGRYCGLDVTDRFYRDGVAALGADLVREKAPRFAVITESVLAAESRQPPDVFLAIAVLKHVPPRELDAQLDRMLRLIGPATRGLLTFSSAPSTMRIPGKGKSWAYPEALLVAIIRAKRPDLRLAVRPAPGDVLTARGLPQKTALWIGPPSE